jgi:hypothetical protein
VSGGILNGNVAAGRFENKYDTNEEKRAYIEISYVEVLAGTSPMMSLRQAS